MATRVAVISIIVEENRCVEEMNQLISQYGDYIIGRMGIPYRKRGISIISLVMEAPQDEINALNGKIGRLEGITSKTSYSQKIYEEE